MSFRGVKNTAFNAGSGVNNIMSKRQHEMCNDDDDADDSDGDENTSNNRIGRSSASTTSVAADLNSAFKSTSGTSISTMSQMTTSSADHKKRKRGDPSRLHGLSSESQLFLARAAEIKNNFPSVTTTRLVLLILVTDL